jgi:hypothetical protein
MLRTAGLVGVLGRVGQRVKLGLGTSFAFGRGCEEETVVDFFGIDGEWISCCRALDETGRPDSCGCPARVSGGIDIAYTLSTLTSFPNPAALCARLKIGRTTSSPQHASGHLSASQYCAFSCMSRTCCSNASGSEIQLASENIRSSSKSNSLICGWRRS